YSFLTLCRDGACSVLPVPSNAAGKRADGSGGTLPPTAPPPPTPELPIRSMPTHLPAPSRRARSPAPLLHIFSVQSPRALPEQSSLHSPSKRPERTANACTTDAAAIHQHW